MLLNITKILVDVVCVELYICIGTDTIYNTNQDPMSICKYFNDLNELFASTVILKEFRFLFIQKDLVYLKVGFLIENRSSR